MPQSSSSYNRSRAVVIVAILAVVGVGFWLSNERTTGVENTASEARVDIRAFLQDQCSRDEFRDTIIIGALQDAKRRAEASLAQNPLQKMFEIDRIQFSIDRLQAQMDDCRKSLPPAES